MISRIENDSKETKRFRLLKGFLTDVNKYLREREDSSGSEDERDSVTFVVGGSCDEIPNTAPLAIPAIQSSLIPSPLNSLVPMSSPVNTVSALRTATLHYPPQLVHQGNSVER